MKRLLFAILIAAAVVSGSVYAELPSLVNYQGKLSDTATGKPVTGTRTMVFELWDSPLGGARLGTFSETQTVTVTNGIFSVIIGAYTPGGIEAPEGVFVIYLSVRVEGEELLPRPQVLPVPFSFFADYAGGAERAEQADFANSADEANYAADAGVALNAKYADNSDKLDSLHAASFLRKDISDATDYDLTVKGDLTVNRDAEVKPLLDVALSGTGGVKVGPCK